MADEERFLPEFDQKFPPEFFENDHTPDLEKAKSHYSPGFFERLDEKLRRQRGNKPPRPRDCETTLGNWHKRLPNSLRVF